MTRTKPQDVRGFVLDTSGVVILPRASGGKPRLTTCTWSDLSSFEQGYVEAMFASLRNPIGEPCYARHERHAGYVRVAFSDLAPSTLAAIRKDCAAFRTGKLGWMRKWGILDGERNAAKAGADFWILRNSAGPYPGSIRMGQNIEMISAMAFAARKFPPLTVSRGDDGLVCAGVSG